MHWGGEVGTSAVFGKMGDVNVSFKKYMVKVCLEVMAEFIIEDCKSKFLHALDRAILYH